ncbi:MAG TPA: hypothetical protein VN838_11015 [Bradyrhizobium sp.]|nr:hypothetical protein [Bradyrhizobium sp.]
MASVQKFIDGITGKTEEDAKQKERFNFLVKTVQSKLELAEKDLFLSLTNQKEGVDKLFIKPETITQFKKSYTVGVRSEASAGIKAAVSAFFGGKDDSVKAGFQKIVETSLDVLLGSTSEGESSEKIYTVAMEHNAFVRVDCYVWKYYFSSKSLSDKVEQAICYTFCKSVIDHTKVPVDTMIFLISQGLDDDDARIKAYFAKMRALYAELAKPNLAASAGVGGDKRLGSLLNQELQAAELP